MPHIDLPTNSPGIRGLFDFRPETAAPLGHCSPRCCCAATTRSSGVSAS